MLLPLKVKNAGANVCPRGYSLSGANDFRPAVMAVRAPKGSAHRYYFRLYALGVRTLGLSSRVVRAELLHAMNRHIMAETQCMGRFQMC
jgi:phosphatidylethanolamine-binding protein (PEBP) family uncharacterized protein